MKYELNGFSTWTKTGWHGLCTIKNTTIDNICERGLAYLVTRIATKPQFKRITLPTRTTYITIHNALNVWRCFHQEGRITSWCYNKQHKHKERHHSFHNSPHAISSSSITPNFLPILEYFMTVIYII